jgi:two-component system, response regulator PdtaR
MDSSASGVPQSPESTVKVMLVEDEYLVAMDIQLALEQQRYEVVGPFRTVRDALSNLEISPPHAAIIDWNLGSETSEQIARALKERNVPFIISTGYGDSYFANTFAADAPIVSKPLELRVLLDRLANLLSELSHSQAK